MKKVLHVWAEGSLFSRSLIGKNIFSGRVGDLKTGFKVGPNSTQRLNYANLNAILKLDDIFDQSHIHIRQKDSLAKVLESSAHTVIAIHQVASQESHDFLNQLIFHSDLFREKGQTIILGTEVSWRQECDKGTFETERLIEFMETNCLVLGHGPKTHAWLIDKSKKIRCIDFPLICDREIFHCHSFPKLGKLLNLAGNFYSSKIISTLILTANRPSKTALKLLLVHPPPGRITKPLQESKVLETELQKRLENVDVSSISPPYSVKDFADAIKSSDLVLVNTRGETFSYVIQDARVLGVPVIHPSQTFKTKYKNLTFESWSRLNTCTFTNPNEVSDLIKSIDIATEGSKQSREARRLFSLDAGVKKWKMLLEGKIVNGQGWLACPCSIDIFLDSISNNQDWDSELGPIPVLEVPCKNPDVVKKYGDLSGFHLNYRVQVLSPFLSGNETNNVDLAIGIFKRNFNLSEVNRVRNTCPII